MAGKSKEEVAFEILSKLKGVGVWGENNQDAILDMYALCLEATSGLRAVDGHVPAALQLAKTQTAAPSPQAPVIPAQAQHAPQAAQNQVPPAFQQAPLQAHAPQPDVRQQQQRVHQAYQQPGQPR